MYAQVGHRRRNDARIAETGQKGQQEIFPAMKKAKGFVSFCVISEPDGNLAISIWESKEDADAFAKGPAAEKWMKTLEEHGHHNVSSTGGEVRQYFTAEE
jgi:heme-degrading monooxygenase HmoA